MPGDDKKNKNNEQVGTVGIISSPQIKYPQVNNFVDPKNSNNNKSQG